MDTNGCSICVFLVVGLFDLWFVGLVCGLLFQKGFMTQGLMFYLLPCTFNRHIRKLRPPTPLFCRNSMKKLIFLAVLTPVRVLRLSKRHRLFISLILPRLAKISVTYKIELCNQTSFAEFVSGGGGSITRV